MGINYSDKTFLIVEENDKFRAAMRGVLQLCGASHIDQAISGNDALNKINENDYDVVLCEFQLGAGKNGQQVLEQVRAQSLLSNASLFIIVTAENSAEVVMGTLEYQPDAYLMKPFTQAMLESRIEKNYECKQILAPIRDAVDAGELDRAIALCEEAHLRRPAYSEQIIHEQAEAFLRFNAFNNAQHIYALFLETSNAKWARLGLSKVYYHQQNYDKAEELLNALINENKLFLEAYDWLAKVQTDMKKIREAENTLKEAIKISPKAIRRQMDLGDLAYKVGDFEVAENSFRQAIKLGRYSVHKTPDNYTMLARSLAPKLQSENKSVRNKAGDETLSTLKEVRDDYKNDKHVAITSMLLESQTYKKLDQIEAANRTLKAAQMIYQQDKSQLPATVKIDMVQTLSILGNEEDSEEIASELAQENIDDPNILEDIDDVMETSALNTEGMAKYRRGHLKAAIEAFEAASKEHPVSVSIHLNAIQALTRHMEENGPDKKYLTLCKKHFSQIINLPSSDKRYCRFTELKALYETLQKTRK